MNIETLAKTTDAKTAKTLILSEVLKVFSTLILNTTQHEARVG